MDEPPRGEEIAATTAPAETVEAVVHGRVQGVGFRWFAQREAMTLDLTGWVANESDGSVRCQATGPRVALDVFIERLREGPPSARVDRVEVDRWPARHDDSTGFSVRSGAHRGD